MSIDFQKIDCNCNDCVFMQRDMVKFQQSLELHKKWEEDHFENEREKLIDKSIKYAYQDEPNKANQVFKEASKMKFIFNKSSAIINYGHCQKLNKDVSFVPNTCQIDTQECFKHRRD